MLFFHLFFFSFSSDISTTITANLRGRLKNKHDCLLPIEQYTAYTLRSIITSVLYYLTIDSLPHVMRESNRSKEYRKI